MRRGRIETVSANNEVDELARHDDRLSDLASVQLRLHLWRLLRPRYELLLGQVGRHFHPVAHLPVHLHDELERLALKQRGVCDRPRLLPEIRVPETLPQL